MVDPAYRRTLDSVPGRLAEVAERLDGAAQSLCVTADFLGGPTPPSSGTAKGASPSSGSVTDAIHDRIDLLLALAGRIEDELGRIGQACR